MTDPHATAPSSDDLDAEALDWFVRFSQAPEAARADAAFQTWLSGHPGRPAAYARWHADWRQLDALPADGIAHLRRQLAADKQAASSMSQATQTRKVVRPEPAARLSWLRFWPPSAPQTALASVLLSLVVGGYLMWDYRQQQPVFAQSFSTERGQQLDVQLPDGSRMRLDTATRVEVTQYRRRREVRLPEGQVVFQVAGDIARPFDVLAGDVKVTVVGTRFSVRHTAGIPGQAGTQVAVEEGRVRVASAMHEGELSVGQTILLTAGDQVNSDGVGHLLPIAPVAASGIAPWRDGRITFDNVPLAQALAEFERYSPTRLVVRDPAVAALRLSGTFDPRRLTNFRQSLSRVLPVRLQDMGQQTEVVAAH